MAMLLIAGIVQIICGIAVIAWMVTELNKNNKSYCDKLYVECKDGKDSDGDVCADGFYGSDAMCQKECIDADNCWGGDPDHTQCAPPPFSFPPPASHHPPPTTTLPATPKYRQLRFSEQLR